MKKRYVVLNIVNVLVKVSVHMVDKGNKIDYNIDRTCARSDWSKTHVYQSVMHVLGFFIC